MGCGGRDPGAENAADLPVVLSPAEVVQFLDCVAAAKHRTILTTCYAAGLRISEAVRLTPPAIDSQRMVLRIEQGKGQKDRYVMLSPKLLTILRDWWRVSRSTPWIFPGDRPGDPITTRAVNRACRKAHRRCGIRLRARGGARNAAVRADRRAATSTTRGNGTVSRGRE